MSDIKQQFFNSLFEYYDLWYESFGALGEYKNCQSPIEEMMCRALYVIKDQVGCIMTIEPQLTIGPYKVDSFVTYIRELGAERKRYSSTVIVECDGHDFHEKTKAQAAKDKGRDRFLQAVAGHTVLHFTGSEIWSNVFKCATEVIEFLDEAVSQKYCLNNK